MGPLGGGVFKKSSNSFGDIDLFVRSKLWASGPWVISGQAVAIIPDTYDVNGELPPGTGHAAYEGRFLLGRSLSRGGWSFLNLEAAYRLGQGGDADQVRGDFSWGVRPWKRWMLLTEASSVTSIGDGSGLPGAAYDSYKARASVVMYVSDRVAIQAGYGVDLVAQENNVYGQSAIISTWVKF